MQESAHPNNNAAIDPKPRQDISWWKTPRAQKVGLVVLVVVLLGFGYWLVFIHPYVSTDDARVAATLVNVAPDAVSGRVIKLNVTEGSRVKKGDVILELDHRIADAQLQRAKAHAELAKRELKRVNELVSQRGLAQKELDTAKATSDIAEADLLLAQTTVENSSIQSPLNGIVVQKVADEGDFVEQGQTVVTITDIDQAWIAANIEETSVGLVKVGQPVQISIDEGGELTGKVSEVRGSTAAQFALIPAENPSGNFTKLVQRIPIKIALDPHPEKNLRTGQSVEIKIRVR